MSRPFHPQPLYRPEVHEDLDLQRPRPRNSHICFIHQFGLPHERILFDPEPGAGGGGGGGAGGQPGSGGDGGGDPPPRTFTQEDFDRQIGKVRAEERRRYADYDSIKEQAQKASEYEAELTKLREEKELEGKSAAEREKIASERAAKALERERAEARSKLTAAEERATAAEKRYRDLVLSNAFGTALDGANVLPQAREKAITLLRGDCNVELDDDGKVTSVTYGGVAYKTPAEAAAQFLKENDYLAAANPALGGGTKPPNMTSSGRETDVRKQTADENFALGLSTPPKPVPGVTGMF